MGRIHYLETSPQWVNSNGSDSISVPFEGAWLEHSVTEKGRVCMRHWWVVQTLQHGGWGEMEVYWRSELPFSSPPPSFSHCPGRGTWLVVVIREACSTVVPKVTDLSSQGFLHRGRDVRDSPIGGRMCR